MSASQIRRVVLLCLMPLALAASEPHYTVAGTLYPDPPLPRMSFGYALDRDGDAMIISNASLSPPVNADDPAVWIYRRSDSGWQREARLLPRDSLPVVLTGAAVAISGDYAVIGTPRGGTLEAGSAYLWGRDASGSWSQIRALQSSQPSSYGNFGAAVDIDGNTLIVGAPYELGRDGAGRGAAHVFQRGDEGWRHARTVEAPAAGSAVASFGRSVGIDASRIVVGAPFSDAPSGVSGAGAAFMFSRNAGGSGRWGLLARIDSPAPVEAGHCGTAVGVAGHRAAVSCHEINEVWVHRVGSSTPPILLTMPSAEHFFGAAIDLQQDRLAVSAHAATSDAVSQVMVYRCADTAPLQCTPYDTLSLGPEHAGFGSALSLDTAGSLAVAVDDEAGSEFEDGGVVIYEE